MHSTQPDVFAVPRGPFIVLAFVFLTVTSQLAHATPTENLNIRILPAPREVTVDGKTGDWDLSGGIFACGDVENMREKMAVWIHTMYDAENLYVLARWRDETPLSNPGTIAGNSGWNGDCLQLRIIADPDKRVTTEKGRREPPICWVTAWQDRDGRDVIDLAFPKGGGRAMKDAQKRGAGQAFKGDEDGKGYVQEMAIPWELLIEGGITPKPGGRIRFSVEPNFNTTSNYRVSIKDIFRPGVTPDRVFTFMAHRCWGYGTFVADGKVEPQKLRLADRREFDVTMRNGVPKIDWTGLFKKEKMAGFEKIQLDMPEDGYVSLNIKNSDGRVVRQLLTANFYTEGRHEVLWDGLTNMSHLRPGEVVEPGAYTWEAIYHTGIGLRLVGWACNPLPRGVWGGDHGQPTAVTTDGGSMFLGWSGSEAGKALVCTDLEGNVRWRHKRGGFGGAQNIAVGEGIVYVSDGGLIYRVSADKGEYSYWEGRDSAMIEHGGDLDGMDFSAGKLYLSQGEGVRVLDADTGREIETIEVPEPGDLEVGPDGAVYLISRGRVLRLTEKGPRTVIPAESKAKCLAVGADGMLYVGRGAPDHRVTVHDRSGDLVRAIGKEGGRALTGPWERDGMRFIDALAVDKSGILWVAEKDDRPKRFSCWNARTGEFVREFFGPTNYGAQGGAISPEEPLTMVGSGCEWRIDEETGRAGVVGVFHRGGMSSTRFGYGPDRRLYVATSASFIRRAPVHIYERLGPGDYRLRTTLSRIIEQQKNSRGKMVDREVGIRVWSDANDDQKKQPDEVRHYRLDLGGWVAGWYLPMTKDMTFYGTNYRIAPTGWTACGAPIYDVGRATPLPQPDDSSGRHGGGMGTTRGLGSVDGRIMVYNSQYGRAHGDFPCYEIATGRLLWSYPSNYVGVHGGHDAPPPKVGMIRAAYDFVGTGRLPEPIGDVFLIGTDKGEWHILTGEGYYLGSLFEGDPMKIKWPENPAPGAIMNSVPPGSGAEDFGGSMIVTDEGELHVQAGKTVYFNCRVVGLDSVKALPGGKLKVSEDELKLARKFREKLLQQSVGTRLATAKKKTVLFTGNLRKDFGVDKPLEFQKSRRAAVDAAIAYDEDHLYLGWQVRDDTPWVNGASDPAEMYARGDTVDFQLGTNPDADPDRREAVRGDLRLSIGPCRGRPTAVIYRRVAEEKNPRQFTSGLEREGYRMDSVTVHRDWKIEVRRDQRRGRYTVEAAVPLSALGIRPELGMKLRGDIGVTHGDDAGRDAVLRTYWNNQHTGLVADEVYELKMQPAHWGRIAFE